MLRARYEEARSGFAGAHNRHLARLPGLSADSPSITACTPRLCSSSCAYSLPLVQSSFACWKAIGSAAVALRERLAEPRPRRRPSIFALLFSSGELAMHRRTSHDTAHGLSPAPHPKRSARSSSAPLTDRSGPFDAEKRLSAAAATRLMLEKWDALDRRQDGRAKRRGSLPTHVESFELWAPEWEKFRLAQVQMEAELDIDKT